MHAASHVREVDVSGVSVGGSSEGASGLRYLECWTRQYT